MLKGEIISRDLFNSANALRCTFPITDETLHEANSSTNEAFNNLWDSPPDSDFCIFDYSKILILFQKIIGKLADTSVNIKWGIRYLFISLKAVLKLAKEKFTVSSW